MLNKPQKPPLPHLELAQSRVLSPEGLALPAMVRVTGDMRVGCGVSLLWRIAHFEAHPVC